MPPTCRSMTEKFPARVEIFHFQTEEHLYRMKVVDSTCSLFLEPKKGFLFNFIEIN